MNKLLQILSLAAIAAVVTVGCAKKPKLNLTHLRETPQTDVNALANNGDTGEPLFTGAGFDPSGAGNGNVGNGGDDLNGANGANGTNGANGGASGWQNMNASLQTGGDAANFLLNGKDWKDRIYFDYNKIAIKPDQRTVLDSLAAYLNANPKAAVVIEGHADQRGTEEYNRALSERRAISIRDYLENLGIARARMLTIGYGEDKPVVPNASSESEYRLNRRGQFLVGDKK